MPGRGSTGDLTVRQNTTSFSALAINQAAPEVLPLSHAELAWTPVRRRACLAAARVQAGVAHSRATCARQKRSGARGAMQICSHVAHSPGMACEVVSADQGSSACPSRLCRCRLPQTSGRSLRPCLGRSPPHCAHKVRYMSQEVFSLCRHDVIPRSPACHLTRAARVAAQQDSSGTSLRAWVSLRRSACNCSHRHAAERPRHSPSHQSGYGGKTPGPRASAANLEIEPAFDVILAAGRLRGAHLAAWEARPAAWRNCADDDRRGNGCVSAGPARPRGA